MTDQAYEEYEYTVPDGVKKTRIDKLLTDAFEDFSRADFHRAFEAGLVRAEGESIPKNRKVSAGVVITFSMPEVEACELGPIDLNIPVVFEDEHLIVVDKPAGLITHSGAGSPEPTLVHALLHLCRGELSGIGGIERPGIVHRLDRETSGLIVAAKTDKAHRGLTEKFKERDIVKEYLALVMGVPNLLSGSIQKPIERHPLHRHKMRVCGEGEGRFAQTDWRLLGRNEERGYSLLRCRIHTGRTHQIRVHLQSIGHAILGDTTYGFRKSNRLGESPERVLLHSEHLAFQHPITDEALDLRAPIPADMKDLVEHAAPPPRV